MSAAASAQKAQRVDGTARSGSDVAEVAQLLAKLLGDLLRPRAARQVAETLLDQALELGCLERLCRRQVMDLGGVVRQVVELGAADRILERRLAGRPRDACR